MSFFGWLRSLVSRPRAQRSSPADWSGYGYLGVVGESQYQSALQQIARRGRLCEATLIPEPENPFDANAVVVKIQGEVVGYLPRSHARRYQRRLVTLTEPHRCPAKLIGGTRDKPSFVVLIDQREVERMPSPKRQRKKRTIDPNEQPF
jgi:hypothetical protein